MRAFVLMVVFLLAACTSLGQSFVGMWKGQVVVEARTKDLKELQTVSKYQAAAKRTSLSLMLKADKTFQATIFNANGSAMTMSGNWQSKGLKLTLTATKANGVKQVKPGVILAEMSKDGKTLMTALLDSVKITKWIYHRDTGKTNGK